MLKAALAEREEKVDSLQAALAEREEKVLSLQAALAEREEKVDSLQADVDKLKSGDDLAKAVQAALTKYRGDAAPSGSGGKRGNPNSRHTPAPNPKRVKFTPREAPSAQIFKAPPSPGEATSLPSPMGVPTDPPGEVPPLALANAPLVAFNDATFSSAMGLRDQGYPSI